MEGTRADREEVPSPPGRSPSPIPRPSSPRAPLSRFSRRIVQLLVRAPGAPRVRGDRTGCESTPRRRRAREAPEPERRPSPSARAKAPEPERRPAEKAPAAEPEPAEEEKAAAEPEPAEKAGADAEAAKAEPAKPADVKVEVDKKEETAPLNAQPGSPVSSESEEKSQGCCIVM